MGQAQLVADLTDDVVMAAFVASVLFVVVYTALAPWWRSEIGRALIVMDPGLALVLGPSVIHRLFGVALVTSIWFSWYYLASIALVAGSTFWRTWLIAKTQWRHRRKPSDGEYGE